MSRELFAFTLRIKKEFEETASFFTNEGQPIGRTLSKHIYINGEDRWFSYDIESTPDIFNKLKSRELKMWNNVGDYSVEKASMCYISKD